VSRYTLPALMVALLIAGLIWIGNGRWWNRDCRVVHLYPEEWVTRGVVADTEVREPENCDLTVGKTVFMDHGLYHDQDGSHECSLLVDKGGQYTEEPIDCDRERWP